MDIDLTFKPIGVNLIENIFPTDVVYKQYFPPVYDPATGEVVETFTDHAIKAGVLYSQRVEQGGAAEDHELWFWVHHDTTGLPFKPKTNDRLVYGGETWKVVEIGPTYQSKGLIASKIKGRCQ